MIRVRLIALACLAAITSSAAAQQSLAVIALHDWYAGISVEGHTDRDKTFRAHHAKDGSIAAIVDGQYRNSGQWKIVEPGHVCITWVDTSWGTNPCWTVFKDGDLWKLVQIGDPSKFVRVKRIEGNAFGM